jgi:hypothetical protein
MAPLRSYLYTHVRSADILLCENGSFGEMRDCKLQLNCAVVWAALQIAAELCGRLNCFTNCYWIVRSSELLYKLLLNCAVVWTTLQIATELCGRLNCFTNCCWTVLSSELLYKLLLNCAVVWAALRSAERRGGKESESECRSRWSRYH